MKNPRSPGSAYTGVPLPPDADQIVVNLDCPEKNGEVMVLNLREIQGIDKNTSYDGFLAFIEMHAEYMADDRKTTFYKCYVHSPNVLVMTVPSWSYPLLYHGDETARAGVGALPNVKAAFEDARLKYKENRQARCWRDIVLEFPPDVKLSAKVVNKDAGEDQMLAMQIMIVEYGHKKMLASGKRVRHYATFTVARTDVDTRKRGKYKDEVTQKSDAADALESLGILAADGAAQPQRYASSNFNPTKLPQAAAEQQDVNMLLVKAERCPLDSCDEDDNLPPETVSSLQAAASRSRAAQKADKTFENFLGSTIQDARGELAEGNDLLESLYSGGDAIMTDETGYKKRTATARREDERQASKPSDTVAWSVLPGTKKKGNQK